MKFALLTSTLLLLAACNSAQAVTPDAANPAHCIAAFSYGRTIMLGGKTPDIAGALNSTARSLFEMKQLDRRGVGNGKEEGAALLSIYGKDNQAMMGLLKACFEKQDADPAFQAANKSGRLMAAARKVDSACNVDPTCVSGGRD